MQITIKQIKQLFLGFFLVASIFLLTSYQASADGPYGWFVPASDYIDSNIPSNCDPNTEASIRVSLVELNTKNPINQSLNGTNGIIHARASDGSEIKWYPFNGNRTADICIDPATEILVPYIENNSNYRDYQGQRYQSPESYPLEMRGHRFQGYLQLVSTNGSDQPFVKPIWPNAGELFSEAPKAFIVANYGFDALYGGENKVSKTRLHLVNHDTNEYFTRVSKTDSSKEQNDIPPPTSLTDGFYWWSVDESMAGETEIKSGKDIKLQGKKINFADIPQSGNLAGGCFSIDSTVPEIFINSITLDSCSSGATADISFEVSVKDTGSGVKKASIYVEETDGTALGGVTINYKKNTSADTRIVSISGIPEGIDIVVYAELTDWNGNVVTSSVTSFNTTCGGTPTGTPVVIDHPTNPISENTATINCEVVEDGGSDITEHGVCWSGNSDLSGQTCSTVPLIGNGIENYSLPLTGLTANTEYFFQCFATNEDDSTGKSPKNSFTTNVSGAPDVTVNPATNIGKDKATLNAEVLDDKGKPITEQGFCWKEGVSGTESCEIVTPPGLGTFSHELTNLTASTEYLFKAYAVNANGRTDTSYISFRTLGKPTVEALPATNVTTNSAILSCDITDNGGFPITSHSVCWNTSANFPASSCVDVVPVVNGGVFTYSIPSGVLNPNTTYHFRCTATNDAGTGNDDGIPFTTKDVGVPVVDNDKSRNVTKSTATLEAEVIDNGGSSIVNRQICWATSSNFALESCIDAGAGMGVFEKFVANLPENSTIYHRGKATNEAGKTGVSDGDSFDNTDAPPPYEPKDPNLSITGTPSIVRAGESTTIEWTIDNVENTLLCTITGPSSFNGGNPLTFTHTYEALGPAVIRDSKDSGALFSSQKFTLSCSSPGGEETYTTSVTIKVVGDSQET